MKISLPKLHWQIFIGMILGVFVGTQITPQSIFLGVRIFDTMVLVGDLFLNGLKMVVIPLIISTIITGTAKIAQEKDLGRLGSMTALYYVLTGIIAIGVCLFLMNTLHPGIIDGKPAQHLLGLNQLDPSVLQHVEETSQEGFSRFLYRLLPPNIVFAATKGELLGLIVFSLLFGYATRHLQSETRKTLLQFWEAVFNVMMHITNLIIRFAPIGVFAFMVKVAATTGHQAPSHLFLFYFPCLSLTYVCNLAHSSLPYRSHQSFKTLQSNASRSFNGFFDQLFGSHTTDYY